MTEDELYFCALQQSQAQQNLGNKKPYSEARSLRRLLFFLERIF